jgi:sarcosine oxidase gamma subunit
VLEIVKRATTISLATPGPCAAVHFAGIGAYLYRFGNAGAVRVHVDRGLVPYLWQWLEKIE